MIDIEKLAEEHLTPFARTGWTAYGEQLKQFAEALLEDKEREIAELKDDYLELRTTSTANAIALMSLAELNAELQAHINDLREALNQIGLEGYKDQSDLNTIRKVIELSKEALSKTPAQSLQDYERLASIRTCARDVCPDSIRTLES